MLLIPKPKKPLHTPELRTVGDLRERNKNTNKLSSPLPDQEGMLIRAAHHKYRSLLDLTAAYKQIRIIPEHVDRTALTTPDGNIVSLVIQMGDCNTPATYQALMNHLFSSHIGRIMDVYLDDILIYADTLEEHIQNVIVVLDILKHEKLYLAKQGGTLIKIRYLGSNFFSHQVLGDLPTYVIRHIAIYGNMTSSLLVLSALS